MRVVDAFCGAGGLSLGAEMAGCEIVAGFDADADAAATYAAAFPAARVACGKLRGGEKLPAFDLLLGGPPCQPFSSSGDKRGILDPRDAVPVFLGLLEANRPTAFVMEEVATLARGKHAEYLRYVLFRMRAAGYAVEQGILQASEHEVPQNRKRLFLVGFRDQTKARGFSWPEKRDPLGIECAIGETVGNYLPGRTRHSRAVLVAIPDPGARMVDAGRGGTRGEKGTTRAKSKLYKWQQPGRPSDTVTVSAETKGSEHALRIVVQPSTGERYERRLHPDEVAAVQTFPAGYPFQGSDRSKLRQIGNAVPPRLAEAVVGRVLAALE